MINNLLQPEQFMPLTESLIKRAKAADRPYRLSDTGGLYLLLNPNGSRWWRMDYRHEAKRKTLSMGTYPDTGLMKARERCDAARRLLAAGTDPAEKRREIRIRKNEHAQRKRVAGTGEHVSKHLPALTRSLEVVGIEIMEERGYRALLAHRMATAEDLAHILSLSPGKTQRLLDNLESKGLASHSPERPRRYIAASPELAVEALVIQRQADLERARSTILELKELTIGATESNQREQVVELITSRAALDQAIRHILQTVHSKVFTFQRPPVFYSGGFAGWQGNLPLPKGLRIRSISDDDFLALPGAMNSLRCDIEAGEEPRVFPRLPVKMIIADKRIGLIPMEPNNPEGPVLLVRASTLLDALCALFELTWEQATPIAFSSEGVMERGKKPPRLSAAAERLLPLLAAGFNDKAIAHEADISINTLTRRVAELMKRFNARTRFQLGWHAAMQGSMGRPPTAR